VQDRSKFDGTQLPPIESFYNTLNDESLSVEDYERAQNVWKMFDIQNLQQYHDRYLLSDVLLLADVFEHFRRDVFEKHGLDCLFYPTLPSLAWSMALKHTQVELGLISDREIYLMLENSIRGGISTISNRYAKANNPLVQEFDPTKPNTYITYLDASNLYGAAQSEPLPMGDFRLLTSDEISQLDIMSIAENSPTGYVIDCDLEYPAHLHDDHSDYLSAPELSKSHRKCSVRLRRICWDKGGDLWKKLIPNLRSKTHYVTHYRNLQFYIKHGLIVTKIPPNRFIQSKHMAQKLDRSVYCSASKCQVGHRSRPCLAPGQRYFWQDNRTNTQQTDYSPDSWPGKIAKSGQQTVLPNGWNNQPWFSNGSESNLI